ncbi:PPK2 family polyphosphate kinase [Paenibacillus beijingensis]|uniref:Polyphosphate kinase n=1 Tax=Paenibacillus beijingensis TaxID=1126833 RepID=A0A0D5NJX6_9BACL|nr:PPK2 family polyphosphate kinase [Paenibacillus beijingensis]AJY75223.1 polyphosphate kinase [Paenibacillus beijingensis]
MLDQYRLQKGKRTKLKAFDPEDTGGIKDKDEIRADFDRLENKLKELQDKLFASKMHAVLVLFQGMDCSGKDGVVKKVLSGLNPNGFRAESFKKPTVEESAHDFLWRTHRLVPAKGYMTAFNRSYYEEVLITRVHGLVSDKEARSRMKHIQHFEKMLQSQNVLLVKIFLHISPEFQLEKIKERMQDPEKLWKFDISDLQERRYWDGYRKAYEDVFDRTTTDAAPWYVVPANNRWFRNYLTLQIIVSAMEDLSLAYPQADIDLDAFPT